MEVFFFWFQNEIVYQYTIEKECFSLVRKGWLRIEEFR